MHRVGVREITGLETLAGKSGAARDFPKFIAAVEASPEGGTVVLDWSGVEVATASYLGGTYLRLLRMTTTGDLDRYLILTGLNETCSDELKLALELPGLVALRADYGKNGTIEHIRPVGKLENAYLETFAAVQEAKVTSASELHQRNVHRQGRIGKTAWINRLAYLHRLRLVRRQKAGRQFVFRPVEEEGKHGH